MGPGAVRGVWGGAARTVRATAAAAVGLGVVGRGSLGAGRGINWGRHTQTLVNAKIKAYKTKPIRLYKTSNIFNKTSIKPY